MKTRRNEPRKKPRKPGRSSKPAPPKWVSQTEFGRLHDVTRMQVNRWKGDGLLATNAKAQVNVAASDKVLEANNLGRFRKEESAGAAATKASTRKENALARLRELDVEEREGRLVDVNEARDLAFRLAQLVQDRLTSWPARVSAQMATEMGVKTGVVSAALEKYVRLELADIAGEIEAAGESGSALGIRAGSDAA